MENQVKSENDEFAILNALLVGYEFLECMDAIKLTPFYRKKLKTAIHNLMPQLEDHCSIFTELVNDTTEISLRLLLEGKKQMIRELALIRPEYKSGFGELLIQFKNQPELTLHRLGISMKKEEKPT